MQFSKAVVAGLACAVLQGCGGGGGDAGDDTGAIAPSNPGAIARAEGAYAGTLIGSASRNFELLVLENDEFWSLYGDQLANRFLVRGFIQGTGTSNNGVFTATDARDFGFVPAVPGTINATYTPGTAVNGTLVANNQAVSFSGGALSALNSSYDYNTAASLPSITGAWTLQGLDGTTATINIAGTGSFSGFNANCQLSGTIAPRASGKNVFNVTVVTGPAPCLNPGSTFTGIGLSYIIQGTATRQLVVAVVNGGRTAGNALFGTR